MSHIEFPPRLTEESNPLDETARELLFAAKSDVPSDSVHAFVDETLASMKSQGDVAARNSRAFPRLGGAHWIGLLSLVGLSGLTAIAFSMGRHRAPVISPLQGAAGGDTPEKVVVMPLASEMATAPNIDSANLHQAPPSPLPTSAAESTPPSSNVVRPSQQATHSLEAEVAQLRDARSKLRDGDANGALVSIQVFRRRFPASALRPEIEALAIEDLIRLGNKDEAKRLADRFVRMYPQSPQNTRVAGLRRSLGEAK